MGNTRIHAHVAVTMEALSSYSSITRRLWELGYQPPLLDLLLMHSMTSDQPVTHGLLFILRQVPPHGVWTIFLPHLFKLFFFFTFKITRVCLISLIELKMSNTHAHTYEHVHYHGYKYTTNCPPPPSLFFVCVTLHL